MVTTLAVLVFLSAIFVAFSQEFGGFFKKIFAIRGAKLIIPLLIATLILVIYEPWIVWGLLYVKSTLHQISDGIANQMPFKTGAKMVADLLIILMLTLIPVIALNMRIKSKAYLRYDYSWLVGVIIWLLVSILLSISLID